MPVSSQAELAVEPGKVEQPAGLLLDCRLQGLGKKFQGQEQGVIAVDRSILALILEVEQVDDRTRP